ATWIRPKLAGSVAGSGERYGKTGINGVSFDGQRAGCGSGCRGSEDGVKCSALACGEGERRSLTGEAESGSGGSGARDGDTFTAGVSDDHGYGLIASIRNVAEIRAAGAGAERARRQSCTREWN